MLMIFMMVGGASPSWVWFSCVSALCYNLYQFQLRKVALLILLTFVFLASALSIPLAFRYLLVL
jgi:hypothetical protein